HSPYRLQACSQIWFDPILQQRAQSFPSVKLRYRTRLENFSQDGNGVRATLRNLETDQTETIEADYLVGCDGANSMVRQQLGITMSGDGTIGQPLHMFFRAPDLLLQNPHSAATFFLLIDRNGFWGNLRIIDPANAVW